MDAHSEPTAELCNLSLRQVRSEPFPHVTDDQFIAPEHYAQLVNSFPTCPPKIGPTGYSLYWGDAGYENLLKQHSAWQVLFKTFHSQSFVDWCCRQFSGVWQEAGCMLDLGRARYVPYREDRIDKERATLRKIEYQPHELWVRMDIHQGQVGYDRPIHLDHARRLLSMLIYMCDQSDNEMVGGELLLHSPDRTIQASGFSSDECSKIKPAHNRMIAFPCSARSYHSVSRILSQRAPRNYLQVHISSSVDIWPRPSTSFWKRSVGKIKQTVSSQFRSS